MHYIQRKDENWLETVDEFETFTEAKAMAKEYRISSPDATFYISSRACIDWNTRGVYGDDTLSDSQTLRLT